MPFSITSSQDVPPSEAQKLGIWGVSTYLVNVTNDTVPCRSCGEDMWHLRLSDMVNPMLNHSHTIPDVYHFWGFMNSAFYGLGLSKCGQCCRKKRLGRHSNAHGLICWLEEHVWAYPNCGIRYPIRWQVNLEHFGTFGTFNMATKRSDWSLDRGSLFSDESGVKPWG